MALTAGDPAPDFTLPGVDGGVRRDYRLSEFQGQPVVLVFYPGDNTPICTRQLNAYTDDVAQFSELDARVLAISPDTIESHEAFAADQGGFAFPLLADVERSVGEAYGVPGPVGFYRRSIFVVDADGTLAAIRRGHAASNFRPVSELRDLIPS